MIRTMKHANRIDSCAVEFLEPRAATQPQRILVADDDEDMRYLFSTILRDAGFEVDTAADGQEASHALFERRYDLLITDNEMPHLSGLELIERVRHAGIKLSILIVSGTMPAGRVLDNRQLRVTGMLPKPFEPRELLNAIRYALGP